VVVVGAPPLPPPLPPRPLISFVLCGVEAVCDFPMHMKKETKEKRITITSQNHHQLPQIIWFKENGRLVRQQQQ
jgi:hypothetical protein